MLAGLTCAHFVVTVLAVLFFLYMQHFLALDAFILLLLIPLLLTVPSALNTVLCALFVLFYDPLCLREGSS